MTPFLAGRQVAVAGNPNSGKTTLVNALTGLHLKVGNYPGVTVEKRQGRLQDTDITLIDLPGTYTLSARSPDEEIARDVLLGRSESTAVHGVLLVIDASNLERNLYLASQVIELGLPVVIACNMMDVAAGRGMSIDCEALARELGVPVIATVADRGVGIDAIRRVLTTLDGRCPPPRAWRLGLAFEEAIAEAAAALEKAEAAPRNAAAGALLWLCDYLSDEQAARRRMRRFLDRVPPEQADALRAAAAKARLCSADPATTVIEARYAWISEVVGRVRSEAAAGGQAAADQRTSSDRIDAILTHRVFGLLTFAGVVFLLFAFVFFGARPLMRSIEVGQHALGGLAGSALPDGPFRSLMVDGIIAGFGAILTFLPQICLLFLYMAILEDSGYMARAAFLMDRLMSYVGLHGKSFIPLVSCHGCAVPGIMATRVIENYRDRLATIMVAPLITCSARLPVYLILVGAVLGDRIWLQAGAMFGLYAMGTLAALVTARILKKTILAGPRSTFIMELPPYHLPRPLPILRATWDRSKLFVTGAGAIIFAACVIIWALSYFPRIGRADLSPQSQARLAALGPEQADVRDSILAFEQLRHSYLGRLGQAIEPAIRPLGFDWRLGVGILSSFLAREAFVGTLGITFAVGEAGGQSRNLRDELASATWPDGRRVLTPAVGIGLMFFYVLACQCVSTLATVRRETRSWRWPIFLFAYTTVLAYTAALLIYQVGSRICPSLGPP